MDTIAQELNDLLDVLEKKTVITFKNDKEFQEFLDLIHTFVPQRFFPSALSWTHEPDWGISCNSNNHMISHTPLIYANAMMDYQADGCPKFYPVEMELPSVDDLI